MYRLLQDSNLYDLVASLYPKNWEASAIKIREHIDISDAGSICEILIATVGWRERAVAAKIISAFGLTELVAPLVKKFSTIPEVHTARAYARMVATIAPSNLRGSLLEDLRNVCQDNLYDANMIEAIGTAANEKQSGLDSSRK